MTSLEGATMLCRLLGDQTRVRLLSLLRVDELTVAELVRVTDLPQPRISTHLRKLREAGFVRDRRSGGSSYYGLNDASWPAENGELLDTLLSATDDPLLAQDQGRARQVIAARGQTWAESVAGKMARHYSPGRTWPALTQGLVGLSRLGQIVDIASGDSASAEILAPHADQVICVDISEKVVQTNRRRLEHLENVRFVQADMHALPFEAGRFDHALMMTSLSYTDRPLRVLQQVRRILRPGGRLSVVALNRHAHLDVVDNYNHLNPGFSPEELKSLAEEAGLEVRRCAVSGREQRPPHFEFITLYANAPTR
ncbi:MAG: metalloregulator ArsR/SmtB family transcription factor [Myxococcota bacterium]